MMCTSLALTRINSYRTSTFTHSDKAITDSPIESEGYNNIWRVLQLLLTHAGSNV